MFMVLRIRLLTVLAGCLLLAGCQALPWSRSAANKSTDPPTADLPMSAPREGSDFTSPTVQQTASFADPNSFASPATNAVGGGEAPTNDEVLRDLQTIGAVDPVAAQQLVERLQNTKPPLRPLVARQFRTSWQYHRELTGSGKNLIANEPSTSVPHTAQLPPSIGASPSPATYAPPAAEPSTNPPAQAPPTAPLESAAIGPPQTSAPSAEPATVPKSTQPPVEVQQASYDESPKLMPVPETSTAATSLEVETPRNWQDALGQTIDQLASKTKEDPRNTSEAYQHVRLRLMHLVAGNKELAMEPVPGLTPTEQTYWTNQLFAMATLLDHEAMPDDQARAGLAATQLAEASARLGELSNLAVKNMTFCSKVYGFGDYDRIEQRTFKPGQTVTLYAEVDNFRSESTDKGYHTSLASSYEILDQAGNRVDGGEFATVDDNCHGKRKDFYIEYTVNLPTRIYASKYQLQVLLRDRLSGKIGKSVVDFEIAE
ncbi:hypothetical protein [Aeoliella sp. SH292]|uniref:hypothetical protein n=1 Tax=Aeoliella sp. SH292 TaxID=3454464 RepID=UPI003F96080F